MELGEYAELAAKTDLTQDPDAGLQIALHGVAGEAGSVVSEAKKWFRDGGPAAGLAERVAEELGDLLWYVAATAKRMGLNLDEIAERNLQKTAQMWTEKLPPPSRYDEGWPPAQRLPRLIQVRFVEDDTGAIPLVRMEPLGELADRISKKPGRKTFGDPLDDNAFSDDGYRYHDVIHLGHVAVLGWSPVLRGLMGAKRKDESLETDRVEDGARAIAIEEGVAAFVFNQLEPDGFVVLEGRLPWELLKHIRRTVRGLEVSDQPPVAWQSAYVQAFSVFRPLRDAHGGVIEADLDEQELRILELGRQRPVEDISG